MRRLWKRVLALVCAVTMVLGSGLAESAQMVNASDETIATEYNYNIFSSTEGTNITSGGSIYKQINSANVNLPTTAAKENLVLYMKLDLVDENSLAVIKKCNVELAQTTMDQNEIQWSLVGLENLQVGVNEIQLKLTSDSYQADSGISLTETINFFRIYETTDIASGDVLLYEVKLIDTSEAGLEFGGSDTYLQLSEPVAETPETIEASVKMDEITKEWTIRSASETSYKYSLYSNGYVTYKTTEEGTLPGADVAYAEAKVLGTETTLGYYGFEKKFSVAVPSVYSESDIALAFWFYSSEESVSKGTLELTSGGKADVEEKWWYVSKLGIKQGWNYLEIPLDSNGGTSGGTFELASVNFIRWYGTTVSNEATFGIADIKLVVLEDEETAEWTIRPAETSAFGYGLGSSLSTGTTTADEAPGEGMAYAQVTVPARDESINDSGKFGFTKTFSVDIPEQYEQGDIALSFWIYSSAGGNMPWGWIELSSSGKCDYNEICWRVFDVIGSLEAGWNYIEISLDSFYGQTADGFDFSNVNYMRWYSSGEYPTMAITYKISDIKFKVLDAVLEPTTVGVLRSASSTSFSYGLSKTVHQTNVNDIGPGAGKTYAKTTVPAGGILGFEKSFSVTVPEQCERGDLAVDFWLYSTYEGTWPVGGAFEITSGGKADYEEIYWETNELPALVKGWNHIILPLDENPHVNISNGTFDYKEMDYLRLYMVTSEGNFAEEQTFGITDIKLVVTNTEIDTTEYYVSVTEQADATAISSKYMVFSNTNTTEETTPYALYITKEGYPSLLWGTSEYTLNYNVCQGQWVDIAVSHDADGYIHFYINGELIASSTVVETDELGTFATAHCIGADGAGGQTFSGKIADIRLWSDVRTATEIQENLVSKQGTYENGLTSTTEGLIGSWYLVGDIQDVLETLPDVSVNANKAVYRGSRAEDWIDYDFSKYDFLWTDADGDNAYDAGEEDYWSMVFIPDIQNLTTGKYTDTWLTAAQWIADNIETENVKHVIGAGDTTWNNAAWQYDLAMQGFDKFIDKVSWSNMVGNHDYVWSAEYRDSTMYQSYFGESVLKSTGSKDTYVGYFDDPQEKTTTENSYYRFSVNGVKWMILQLEYHPRTTVLEWAKQILAQYPLDNVILTTHGYISGTGGYIGESMTYINNTEEGDGTAYIESTSTVWEYLKEYTNIKYILCGHSSNGTGAIATKTETNAASEEVMALMVNAQDMDMADNAGPGYYTNKALGMLGIFRFSKDGSQVALQWYAPQYDKSFSPEDPSGNRDSNNITLSYETETCTPEVVPYTEDFEAGKEPTDMADYNAKGYVFAGWFTNEECTKALTTENQANVTQAYAKYVDAEILSVKAQLSGNLYDTNTENDGTGAIRFVTTIDSRKYQKVGFVLKVKDGAKEVTVGSDEIYEVLYAVNETSKEAELIDYRPDRFSPESEFFKTFTLTGFIDSDSATFNFDTQITAKPYWITQDGTTVYGTAATKSINMGLGN